MEGAALPGRVGFEPQVGRDYHLRPYKTPAWRRLSGLKFSVPWVVRVLENDVEGRRSRVQHYDHHHQLPVEMRKYPELASRLLTELWLVDDDSWEPWGRFVEEVTVLDELLESGIAYSKNSWQPPPGVYVCRSRYDWYLCFGVF